MLHDTKRTIMNQNHSIEAVDDPSTDTMATKKTKTPSAVPSTTTMRSPHMNGGTPNRSEVTTPTTTKTNKMMVMKLDQPPMSLCQIMDDEEYCRKRKAALLTVTGHHKVDGCSGCSDGKILKGEDSEIDRDNSEDDQTKVKSDPFPWKLAQDLQHFSGQPLPMKRHGSCAECGLDEDVGDIVLCDGHGCDQEFHLQCCRPPLEVIPDGDFYCFYCCPDGSTKYLEAYLDGVEKEREDYIYCDSSSSSNYCSNKKKPKIKSFVRGTSTKNDLLNESLFLSVLQGIDDLFQAENRLKIQTENERHNESVSSLASNSKKSFRGEQPRTSLSVKDSSRPRMRLDFVDHILLKDMIFQHPARFIKGGSKTMASIRNKESQSGKPSTAKVSTKATSKKNPSLFSLTELDITPLTLRIPHSEIENRYFADDLNNLIGKPLKLYCLTDKQYHTGRIIMAQRPFPPPLDDIERIDDNSEQPDKKISGSRNKSTDVGTDIECLVRFGAGMNYRKTSLTRWIRLEEHSVLVAQDCLWCRHTLHPSPVSSSVNSDTTFKDEPLKVDAATKISNGENFDEWMRGTLWIRSSRELIKCMGTLKENLGQIRFRPLRTCDGRTYTQSNKTVRNPSTKHAKWGLVAFFGGSGDAGMQLKDISQDILAEDTATLLASLADVHLVRGAEKPPISSTRPGRVALALEKAEFEEQTRVRQWVNEFPIVNPWALTSASHDEYKDGGLFVLPHSADKAPLGIDQTPLARSCIDRMYIINQFIAISTLDGTDKDNKKVRTRDLALSMMCELDDSRSTTLSVQALNQQHQNLVDQFRSFSQP